MDIYKKKNLRGLSERGFTLVEMLFVIVIIFIVAVIAVPSYLSFIQKARETAVISFLGNIKRGEQLYMDTQAIGNYSGDFTDIAFTGAVAPGSAGATRTEHDYTFVLASGQNGAGEPFWNVKASPTNSDPKARWFYIDETGIIRYETGREAGVNSPELKP